MTGPEEEKNVAEEKQNVNGKNKAADGEVTVSIPRPSIGKELELTDAERLRRTNQELLDVRTAMESLRKSLTVVQSDYEALRLIVFGNEESVVHACPPEGSSVMPCCNRSPFDVPLTERISLDGKAVTCQGIFS